MKTTKFNLALIFPSKNWSTILSKNSAHQPCAYFWDELDLGIKIYCNVIFHQVPLKFKVGDNYLGLSYKVFAAVLNNH